MATTKKITIEQALAIAYEVANGADVATTCDTTGYTVAEYRDKLAAMLTQERKRRTGKKAPTADQRRNEAVARELAALIAAEPEPVTTAWIVARGGAEIRSPQKATALMTKAIALGLIEKVRDEKGKVSYRAA